MRRLFPVLLGLGLLVPLGFAKPPRSPRFLRDAKSISKEMKSLGEIPEVHLWKGFLYGTPPFEAHFQGERCDPRTKTCRPAWGFSEAESLKPPDFEVPAKSLPKWALERVQGARKLLRARRDEWPSTKVFPRKSPTCLNLHAKFRIPRESPPAKYEAPALRFGDLDALDWILANGIALARTRRSRPLLLSLNRLWDDLRGFQRRLALGVPCEQARRASSVDLKARDRAAPLTERIRLRIRRTRPSFSMEALLSGAPLQEVLQDWKKYPSHRHRLVQVQWELQRPASFLPLPRPKLGWIQKQAPLEAVTLAWARLAEDPIPQACLSWQDSRARYQKEERVWLHWSLLLQENEDFQTLLRHPIESRKILTPHISSNLPIRFPGTCLQKGRDQDPDELIVTRGELAREVLFRLWPHLTCLQRDETHGLYEALETLDSPPTPASQHFFLRRSLRPPTSANLGEPWDFELCTFSETPQDSALSYTFRHGRLPQKARWKKP